MATRPRGYRVSYNVASFSVAATAAARFLAGEVGSQDLNVETLMWHILESLANGGAGIADETCASAALSEFGAVEVPRAKFDKDGFAPGIEREKLGGVWPLMLTGDLASYVKFAKEISRKRLPSVGVLKEG